MHGFARPNLSLRAAERSGRPDRNHRVDAALGAAGAIAAILTAVPQMCVALWNAVQAGDHTRARELHELLLPIWNAIFAENLPANVRSCMKLQGREGGVPRPPMPAASDAQQSAIREALGAANVI